MTRTQKVVHWLADHHVINEKHNPKYERYSLTITIKKIAARMRH